jgi:hypothetical protein
MTDLKQLIERLRKASYIEKKEWGALHEQPIETLFDDALAALESLSAENAELREALKPYSDFGVNVDENGWTSNIHREPISTWFGPSDFRTARAKLEGSGK